MDMVYTNGMMVENMKGNIFMIKKKVLENIIGTMDDNLKAFGKMAFNMEKELILFHLLMLNGAFGIMEKEWFG